jgi:hypothetical protein
MVTDGMRKPFVATRCDRLVLDLTKDRGERGERPPTGMMIRKS